MGERSSDCSITNGLKPRGEQEALEKREKMIEVFDSVPCFSKKDAEDIVAVVDMLEPYWARGSGGVFGMGLGVAATEQVGVAERPVGGMGMARPDRTDLGGGVVADRNDKVHDRGVFLGELKPTF